MWIKRTTYPAMSGEPQLGNITETELMGSDEEALDILIGYMETNQEVPEEFYAIDDFTDEDIPLQTSDYLSDKQIDFLNALFIEDDKWSATQLKAILEELE